MCLCSGIRERVNVKQILSHSQRFKKSVEDLHKTMLSICYSLTVIRLLVHFSISPIIWIKLYVYFHFTGYEHSLWCSCWEIVTKPLRNKVLVTDKALGLDPGVVFAYINLKINNERMQTLFTILDWCQKGNLFPSSNILSLPGIFLLCINLQYRGFFVTYYKGIMVSLVVRAQRLKS